MNKILVVIIVLLGLALPAAVYYHLNKSAKPSFTAELQNSEVFDVRVVRVVSGHEFDVTIQDGRLMHVKLAVTTPVEAKRAVVWFLHDVNKQPAKLVVDKKNKAADLLVKVEGNVSLTSWLKCKKLVF